MSLVTYGLLMAYLWLKLAVCAYLSVVGTIMGVFSVVSADVGRRKSGKPPGRKSNMVHKTLLTLLVVIFTGSIYSGCSSDSGGGSSSSPKPSPTTPAITTASLPVALVGGSYSETLDASGGAAPYTYDITSGSLPAGLSLDSSSGNILGTPSSGAGQLFSFRVRVTDSLSARSSRDFELGVSGGNVTVTNGGALPDGQVGVPYNHTMLADTGAPPYTWSIYSGSLPNGLSLDADNGDISGTPTLDGVYNGIGVQVNSPDGSTHSTLIGITVYP